MYTNIDEYILECNSEVQPLLHAIRQTIREAAPDATEKISYQMPTFYQLGNVIHFAAQRHHIGLHPGASGVEHFLPRLAGFKTSKGTIQLPLDKPIPHELIAEITRFRIQENIEEAERKKRNR